MSIDFPDVAMPDDAPPLLPSPPKKSVPLAFMSSASYANQANCGENPSFGMPNATASGNRVGSMLSIASAELARLSHVLANLSDELANTTTGERSSQSIAEKGVNLGVATAGCLAESETSLQCCANTYGKTTCHDQTGTSLGPAPTKSQDHRLSSSSDKEPSGFYEMKSPRFSSASKPKVNFAMQQADLGTPGKEAGKDELPPDNPSTPVAASPRASNIIWGSVDDSSQRQPARLAKLWTEVGRGSVLQEIRDSGRSTAAVFPGRRMNVELMELLTTLRGTASSSGKESATMEFTRLESDFNVQQKEGDRWARCCPGAIGTDPHSAFSFFWDILGGLLISNDLLLIPVQWAFADLADFEFLDPLKWVTAIYWTIDFGLRFVIGYETVYGLELRIHRIVRHYLMTWFLPDLGSVVVDWYFMVQGEKGVSGRSWYMVRALRTLRTLPRSFKFIRLAQRQLDRGQSERMLFATKVLYGAVCVLFTAHYVACSWYWLGKYCHDQGRYTWISIPRLENADLDLMYAASLHWALAQSGLASIDIHPNSTLETVFAVSITMLWIYMLPGFISFFTTCLISITELEKEQKEEIYQVRKFLAQNPVSSKLLTTVVRFLRRSYHRRAEALNESEVSALSKLPNRLLYELRRQVYKRTIDWHPMFVEFHQVCAFGAGCICHFAVECRGYAVGQQIFQCNAEAEEMIFVVRGNLKYFPRGSSVPVLVERGDWLSEAALWLRGWLHRGELVAASNAQVVAMHGIKFRELMEHGEQLGWPVEPLRKYAAMAADKYIGTAFEQGTDLGSADWAQQASSQAFKIWGEENSYARHFFRTTRQRIKYGVHKLKKHGKKPRSPLAGLSDGAYSSTGSHA